uniref:Polyprotein protein n=1 Tax=Solanum tuberosum TaxID=4113 RepID=M1DEM3_SOLTU
MWGGVDVPEDPSFELTLIPTDLEIPPTAVTGDVAAPDEDGESDTLETDEKDLVSHEIDMYEDLDDLEGDMLWVVMKASLCDTSMINSSGSKPIEEVVAHPSRVGVEMGIDAQVEVAPMSESSPQA